MGSPPGPRPGGDPIDSSGSTPHHWRNERRNTLPYTEPPRRGAPARLTPPRYRSCSEVRQVGPSASEEKRLSARLPSLVTTTVPSTPFGIQKPMNPLA